MKGILLSAVLMILAVQGTRATDDRNALLGDVITRIQQRLFIAYLCRRDLGEPNYSSTRTATIEALERFGAKHEDAVLVEDGYEQQIIAAVANHPPGWLFGDSRTMAQRQSFCYVRMNNAQSAAVLAIAKASAAFGLD